MQDRDTWLILPLIANAFLALASFIAGPVSFTHDSVACYLVALFSCLVAFGSVLGFVVHDIGRPKAFLSLLLQGTFLVVIFATIYANSQAFDRPLNAGDALYYSLATWTGRGYIDVGPAPNMRPLAAIQSMTGYLYLALLISILAGAVGREITDQKSEQG